MKYCILHIKDGQISNPGAVRKLFEELKDGKYMIEISVHNKRSTPQNRYYWGLVIPLVQKGIYDLGTELTREETHEFLKSKFNSMDLTNTETGETVQVPRSTTILTKLRFSEYVQSIQQFAAEFLNVVIPDPGQQMMMEV